MLSGPLIISVAFFYLGLLFAIAYYGDKRADRGPKPDRQSRHLRPVHRRLLHLMDLLRLGRPGGVERGRFPADLPWPTLTFILGWIVIRKIIRISKVNRTTSIADFIASRYGKSFQLGGLVTVIAVVGILPTFRFSSKRYRRACGSCCTNPTSPARAPRRARSSAAGHRALHRPDHGRVRDPVRHAAHRCERTTRGHGRGHCFRVRRQAPRLPARWRLRDLGAFTAASAKIFGRGRSLGGAQPAVYD